MIKIEHPINAFEELNKLMFELYLSKKLKP